MLKKEFAKKDVERIRNLVKGKYGEKTQTSVGYSKKEKQYKEGDVWTENGRKWTIKDGIRQNITKMDKFKNSIRVPLFCPSCKKQMKNRHDPTFYKIHNICYKCVVIMEEKLKKEGKWEEYENSIINDEIDNKIVDFKEYIKERLKESNDNFISEDGDVEQWVGKVNKDRVNDYVDEVVQYLESIKR